MDLTELKQEIEQLEDNGVKEIFHEFLSKLIARDESIVQLQNRVNELETQSFGNREVLFKRLPDY